MSAPRSFAVDRKGSAVALSTEEHVTLMGVSPAVSAAYDLLTDGGVPSDRAASLALAAERDGQEPEAFARHFIKLLKAAMG